jgi:hypothetical protein
MPEVVRDYGQDARLGTPISRDNSRVVSESSEQMSCTIYARSRPTRTAFVIDTNEFPEGTWRCDALLDGIVAAAMMTWGGRDNAIVLIEQDKDLSADQWRLVEAFDPDRVQAFAPL